MPGEVHPAMVDVDVEEEVAMTETGVDMEDGECRVFTCAHHVGGWWIEKRRRVVKYVYV